MSLSPCEPDVREARSGWLATTPPEYPYRIGVVGGDPDEARERFQAALDAWRTLHDRSSEQDQP